MNERTNYHVVYYFEKYDGNNGPGTIHLTVDKIPVNNDVVQAWADYIKDKNGLKNVIITNFIELAP